MLNYSKIEEGVGASKFVDKVHYIKPIEDVIGKVNVEKITMKTNEIEKEFIDRILEICTSNSINVVIPTSEFEYLVFSKNLQAFNEKGITVTTSSFTSLCKSMDKFTVMQEAKKVGLPCPNTILPNSYDDVERFSQEVSFPLIVKVRFSNNSNGVKLVKNLDELIRTVKQVEPISGWPALQEYIPGTKEPSVHLIMNKHQDPKLLFTLRKHRYLASGYSTCIQTTDALPETDRIIDLMRSLGLVGYAGIQMKLDERDGKHKLIEINPRWGANSRIHMRLGLKLGVNSALRNIQAFIDTHQDFYEYPSNVMGVSVFEDLLAFRTYLRVNKSTEKNKTQIPPITKIIKSYSDTYLFRRATHDFIWNALLYDRKMAMNVYKGVNKEYKNNKGEFVPWGDLMP
ncbi:ATP-grasp domain-containing protein [Bacillus cereus group sp. BfR-BA-01380]|uniref:ATP-grasp domain-containing protein n=1 Tax=Bacillus cereus group sp. BfR-BA-01380 TaxID=2920324 RepID=UPI001F5992D0|nr:ATP-grasp domain-containing protein [Bacillus cereus group sp. BfR-BA-01380]